ncbi:MAG: hypothetical protein ACXVPN_11510 [Bacteroidia bacterium]
MSKKLSYLFLLFSLVIIVSHNITAHHHHSEFELTQSATAGDGENDNDHNIFSFGQLDEAYLHSNDQVVLDNDFVFCLNFLSVFSFNEVPRTLQTAYVVSPPTPLVVCLLTSGNSRRGPPVS